GKDTLDLYLSAWVVVFSLTLPVLWAVGALVQLQRRKEVEVPNRGAVSAGDADRPGEHTRFSWRWALLLLALCLGEALTHSGERNGWVASSRPTGGVETWTTA